MLLPELEPFLSWFQRNGGTIDLDAIGFKCFPSTEGGRGAVALKNIEKERTLFTVPRSLILSIKTSSLPEKFGPKIWKECKLDTGWSGLILCMMWEDAQTLDSKWYHYLAILPTAFNTPMFWNDQDLKDLEGTPVVEKLGKEDAERDYHDKVLLALQRRPDLFPPESIPNHYSLERYHVMGSRILSRSFDIEHAGTDDVTLEEELNNEGDRSIGSAMDVDDHNETAGAEDVSIQDGPLLEDEDENDAINVSMVPVADLLNARFGSENAKLFYEDKELKMITTKPISAGQQIWNTYNDLPNSELLRKYGHVDVLPLSGGGNGNPADVVEIRADLVLSTFLEQSGSAATSSSERIDWWLEQGGDDIFVLETNFEIPEAMISLTRLLYLSSDEWEKARDKEKPPKPRLDSQASGLISLVLQKRIAHYPSTMKEDEEMFENEAGMPLNKYQALIVRLGEKRILNSTLQRLQIAKSDSSQKRKSAPPGPNVSKKKAKR
ncbi:hypothetical protein F5890DRAFT_1527670 [Lentinula detonsa]|uniref:Ribosomal lysine N-methyltransferase 4 n=1 Tax=Lentinula detonsa TaxID=2804962 RepID=A0AA38PVJ5_9AGAR|nr:hypothetical protein F5890DRAFT_1527670 [Lentinula detonsa]